MQIKNGRTRVYIDGQSGTTGLQIYDRIGSRDDLELLRIDEDKRHDNEERRRFLNAADIVFLCLPDDGAREAVSLIDNPDVRVIDASTAHRTSDDWTYGYPELSPEQREAIAHSHRVANPGCHATGFISCAAPLVRTGLVPADYPFTCFSLTGYSGGGKKMIADYETAHTPLHDGGRQYALGQTHKHLPEMSKVCGLEFAPCFSPVVVPHLSGMEVTVPLHGVNVETVRDCYREYYGKAGLVAFVDDPAAAEGGFLSSAGLSGRDDMEVSVYGNDDRAVLVSRFDNLGKGASGAAIQNMNLVLGCPEDEGLVRRA